MDRQDRPCFQLSSQDSPLPSSSNSMDISIFFAWNQDLEHVSPDEAPSVSNSEQPGGEKTKRKKNSKIDQIEDPS